MQAQPTSGTHSKYGLPPPARQPSAQKKARLGQGLDTAAKTAMAGYPSHAGLPFSVEPLAGWTQKTPHLSGVWLAGQTAI